MKKKMDKIKHNQFKYVLLFLIFFILMMWYLAGVLLPFILAGFVAYALDPIVDRFERFGIRRVFGALIISLIFLGITFVILGYFLPLIFYQTVELLKNSSTLIEKFQIYISNRFPFLQSEDLELSNSLKAFGEIIKLKSSDLIQGVFFSTVSVLNFLMFLLIVPVVSFYLLLDWNKLIAHFSDLIPRKHFIKITKIASDIDKTLASFIRGQLLICFLLSIYYSVGLFFVGLEFGLVVGVFAGVISFIPYVGAIFGGGLALFLALFQFWNDVFWIGIVAGIFLLGQLIEGNFLSPYLIGKNVGLHPVWLLLSLTIFSALFGFAGLLLAVPVAAILGVIVRYFFENYKSTNFYNDPEDN